MRVLLVVGLLLSACVAAPLLAADDDGPIVKREDIERDLVIEAELASPKTIQPGQNVRVTAKLVNRSKSVTHRIVRPGDGSESGWREPWVYWSATLEAAPEVVTEIPNRGIGRCGLYDANWHDEVEELAPGESIALQDWMPAPSQTLDFQRAGTVRLRLHYVYRAGAASKGGTLEGPRPEGVGPMKGVEAFEIVSEPVEILVVRPLDVTATATRPISSKQRCRATALIAATVQNTTGAPLELRPREWTVALELSRDGGWFAVREAIGKRDPDRRAERVTLKPGETRDLFGPDGLVPDFGEHVQAADDKPLRISVVLYAGVTNTRRIAAPPITLDVSD